MKTIPVVLLAVLLVTGCRYAAPLSAAHDLPIDPAALGCWEPARDASAGTDDGERLLILRFSPTEYLIHHDAPADARYYRAYPIEVGGVACVQLQVIGTPAGPPEEGAKPYDVVSYALDAGDLVIRQLNTDLIDEGLRGEALRAAFLAHKDHPDLFRDPVRFQRRP
jgi:hypothetical protein